MAKRPAGKPALPAQRSAQVPAQVPVQRPAQRPASTKGKHLIAVLVVVAALAAVGIGLLNRRPPAPLAPAVPAPTPAVVAAAPIPTRDQGTISLDQRDWRSMDDPAQDGWDTEVLQGLLAKQLGLIAEAVQAGALGQAQPLAWADLAMEDVAGTALLPGDVSPVRTEGGLVVRDQAPKPRLPGIQALQASIQAVVVALRSPGVVTTTHVEWKIDGVQATGDSALASLRLFATSSGPTGAVDVTSRLHSRWQRGNAGKTGSTGQWRLTELRAENTQVVQRTGGPWLSDATTTWLGASPLLQEIALDNDAVLQRVPAAIPTDPIGHTGVALADVDGDGLDDVYVGMSSGLPNRLLLGVAGGGLRDGTAGSNADYLEETRAILLLDLDGDGRRELVTATSAGLMLAPNDTKPGQSVHFGPPRPLLGTQVVHCLSAADIDNDGDLDLYAGKFYGAGERGNAGFPVPVPYHDADNGGRNVLLRNDGNLRFVDATDELGLDVNNRRFTLATAFHDLDGDGDMDLYVANDHGRNVLYRNDRSHFSEVAAAGGVEDIGASMSAAFGDADGDGDFDLYVSDMYSSAGNRIVPQAQFHAVDRDKVLRHARGNSLFTYQGDGTFADRSEASGAMIAGWAWGSRFVDLDCDGRQDLLVANGLFTRPDSGDL
ncbi:MAG: VCBS repeat-containing protein [Myxococcales bacterium]|nr:VCBS repeat-containing protein [Myxococcales bacterium]